MTEDSESQTISSDLSGSARFAEFGRHVGLTGAARVAVGVVVGGLGGRLVMRIAALAAPDSVMGDLTENGFPIGDFTVGGTMQLLLFGGLLLGGIGAVVYLMVEPWLEWAGAWRGMVFAGFLVAANSTTVGVLDPDGIDFVILGNSTLIVGMFLLLFLLYGCFSSGCSISSTGGLPALIPTGRLWTQSADGSLWPLSGPSSSFRPRSLSSSLLRLAVVSHLA